jgi:multidrug efflux system outer membrane protein
LQRLLNDGITYNNDLLIATKRIDIARQQVLQAKQLWLPEANLQLSGQYNRPSKNSLNGLSANSFLKTNHIDNFLGSVNVSWEADVWGKIGRQKEVALADYLQTYEAAKAVQTRLVADISQGYYNLLMLDKQLDIANSNLALNDSILKMTSLLKDAGEVTTLGVQQADAQRQATALLIPQLQQSISLQENALQLLTGHLPGHIQREKMPEEAVPAGEFPTGLPAAILGRRPDVRAAEYLLVAANAEVGIAKAQMYPALNITAGGGVESFQFINWFNIPSSLFGLVTGTIVQPLLNRRRLRTAHETAQLRREQQVIGFRQSVLVAVTEVENALVRIDRLKQQKLIAGNRADTLEKAVGNARLLFQSALANYLEVITAQGNALQAQLELAAVEREQFDAVIELYRSLGAGWK